ncbi:hypothetical protein KYK30_30205 [Shinella yambaruensis]|uniref:Uncharacterized protein n=1 Tax=Shinella yambaruensis TaxID=415996 RepID=A0ABQ5ZAR9_9HYPH|nr:hypothetical protein [Shinella yambaruensis]MCJ8028744.1 hypothetical protein [Shinella yambaruensis]MCU7983993.1 hypothetical protein [Shinella yambaruensis]GLR49885.1 hypothetical protein GCM10007923_10900 [Shinella yambaruensis]
MKRKNPATGIRGEARNIQHLGGADVSNLTENPDKSQSEMLAARSVMRRFGVSYFHALTVCQLSGLGGTAA